MNTKLTKSVVFCPKCAKNLPAGVCARCATNNEELDDTCRNCNTTLIEDPQQRRKLKPSGSHPESPQRKTADRRPTTPAPTTYTNTPVPDDGIDAHTTGNGSTTSDTTVILDTLERLLDKKFQPMHDRFTNMESQIRQNFLAVNSRVDTLQSEVQQSTSRIETLETQIQQRAEQRTTTGQDSDISNKLKHIEKTIANMHGPSQSDKDDIDTAVFGGFSNSGPNEAETWIANKIKDLHLPAALEMYYKGEQFQGVMHVKMNNADSVRRVAKEISKAQQEDNAQPIWCKQDRPALQRHPLSFLLGLRRQLALWGTYSKSAIQIKDDDQLMIDGKPIVAATIDKGSLKLDWKDETWGQWSELKESPEFLGLVHVANDKIKKSLSALGKGKGKSSPSQP